MATPNKGKVVLKVTVEVTDDHSETILVREGDTSRQLAIDFCKKHSVNIAFVDPLSAHIQSNLDRIGGKPSARTSSRSPVRDSAASSQRSPNGTSPRGNSVGRATSPVAAEASSASGGAGVGLEAGGTAADDGGPLQTTELETDGARRGGSKGPTRGPVRTPASSWGSSGASVRKPPSRGAARGARGGPAAAGPGAATPRGTSAPHQRHPPPAGSSVFEKLYENALAKSARLESARQRARQDLEAERAQAMAPAPGSARLRNRSRESSEAPGERLYRLAQNRQEVLAAKRQQAEEEKLRLEMDQATFRPSIDSSQRACSGIARNRPEAVCEQFASKSARLRQLNQQRTDEELQECTFKPAIDQRSDQLIADRLSRLKITGSVHDHLYADACRWQLRREELGRCLPDDVTFRPDIGWEQYRPSNDDSREGFIERLSQPRERKEAQLQSFQFHPATGRGPQNRKNRNNMPIGEFLYEQAKDLRAMQESSREAALAAQIGSTAPNPGSQRILKESRWRAFQELFEELGPVDGALTAESLHLETIGEEMLRFIDPILQYLEETGSPIMYEQFGQALEYKLEHAAEPCSHLFVKKVAGDTSTLEQETFHPALRGPAGDGSRSRDLQPPLREAVQQESKLRDVRRRAARMAEDASGGARVVGHPTGSLSSNSTRGD
eukprot:CAMPEP_0204356344 /NCGR_PEP_ID=MMETSP0469-20131031/34867_1 /ASSEMBLY_ACC=CAM_ASM_000384 /TAXON_ID=2969 /ORGANISM="Oxyrrhis marina" /LENGTH=669 /DNA_ID=CAMNT_0051343793 /DNA_START=25 /DNA_END=2037 /DNA_ORIENTATION=+